MSASSDVLTTCPGLFSCTQQVHGLLVRVPPASPEHVAETQTFGLPCTCGEDQGLRSPGAGWTLPLPRGLS